MADSSVKITASNFPSGEKSVLDVIIKAKPGRVVNLVGLSDATIDAPANAWVRVIGVYSNKVGTDPVNKAKVAYLTVKSWEQISEPENPYA